MMVMMMMVMMISISIDPSVKLSKTWRINWIIRIVQKI